MWNKICWRIVLSRSTKSYTLEWKKLSQHSVRMITTNQALCTVKNEDKKPPVKVYVGVLSSQIRAVKAFSLSSSIIGLVAQPMLYKAIVSTGNVPIIVAAYSFVGFFTFGTPILLHLITKKYVTCLEHIEEDDKYIAYTLNFFCIPKKLEFKLEDVTVPDIPGMFTTLKVKGQAIFFDPRNFEDTNHYAKLMGFDKPIDLKLGELSPNETKPK